MDTERESEDTLLKGLTDPWKYYSNSNLFYLENIAENRERIDDMTVLIIWWNTVRWWYHLILKHTRIAIMLSGTCSLVFGGLFQYYESWYFFILSLMLPVMTVSCFVIDGTIECVNKSKLHEDYLV